MKTVKDMIREKLVEMKADGLSDGEGCGCRFDDFMPCGMASDLCCAAMLCESSEAENAEFGEKHGWVMRPIK